MRQVVIALLFTVLVASCGEKSSGRRHRLWLKPRDMEGHNKRNHLGSGATHADHRAERVDPLRDMGILVTESRRQHRGTLSGTAERRTFTVTLTDSNPTNCSYNLTGPVSGSQMSLTYASFNCPVAFTGTVTLTKQ